jgi:hypothetical protein
MTDFDDRAFLLIIRGYIYCFKGVTWFLLGGTAHAGEQGCQLADFGYMHTHATNPTRSIPGSAARLALLCNHAQIRLAERRKI